MEGKEIFQITDFKKYDIIGCTSCSPKPLYINIKLRGLQTQRRQQERERHKKALCKTLHTFSYNLTMLR